MSLWVKAGHVRVQLAMSALHPKADIRAYRRNVRFVPKADMPPFIRLPRRRGQATPVAR
jgi:hypothetical protein